MIVEKYCLWLLFLRLGWSMIIVIMPTTLLFLSRPRLAGR
jgi:hypothetical protein